MKFFRCAIGIFHKDLLSELRKREHINSIFFFALLILFLFSFALGTEPLLLQKLTPGLLWLAILFSSTLALERSFQAETESGCLDGLLLYSISPRAVFLGKLLSNLFFIVIVQIIVTSMMFILYGLDAPKNFKLLLLVFILGDVGIATLGTFYAVLTTKTKARYILLPLLLFPMLIPLLLGSVYVTQYALEGSLFSQSEMWLSLLGIYDSVFLAACFMAVGPLLEA